MKGVNIEMNTKEFDELMKNMRKETRKIINIEKTLHLLDKLRKATHTALDDIDLNSLIKLLKESEEVEDESLGTFSSNFFKSLVNVFNPKTVKELSILVGITMSNGTYTNNIENLVKEMSIYEIPTNQDDLIDCFKIKTKTLISKIKMNLFDEEFKVLIKTHEFPKKYKSRGKDYALKINYLFSRKEILLHTILGLYLFYFLIEDLNVKIFGIC